MGGEAALAMVRKDNRLNEGNNVAELWIEASTQKAIHQSHIHHNASTW